MKILIIGGGGREHAMTWKAAQSSLVSEIYVAPGNPGIAQEPKTQIVNIEVVDIPALLDFAVQNEIDLTIVGPEAPLAAGIVDQFTAHQLPCFGPTRAAAQLEASKAFSKSFMERHRIPTARYASFNDFGAAQQYVTAQGTPIVIKADGLAAGKGVTVAFSLEQAYQALEDIFSTPKAQPQVVIEEYLTGEEASFIVIVDGKTILPLATSQDHKARDNSDKGPNTGGMGAYSPAPVITPALQTRIMEEVMEPAVRGMAEEGHPYSGFLYAGVMITPDEQIKVLEFNCRLGDPETQPLMLRLNSDLVKLIQAAYNQTLDTISLDWDPRPAVGVVLAAKGYPSDYIKGSIIEGLESIAQKDCKVFHAGTALQDGQFIINGGRVLCATALGETVQAAQHKAYQIIKQIHCDDLFFRTDIGYRAIARENEQLIIS